MDAYEGRILGRTKEEDPIQPSSALWGEFPDVARRSKDALLESGFGEARQMGFSDEVDMWTRKGLEVTIDYSGEKDAIRCLTVGVPINRNDT